MTKWIFSFLMAAFAFVSHAQEVVTIDDHRFTDNIAKQGLRAFETFPAAGLYMLQDFDPTKPVIVMVHGANGHPGNFKELAKEAQERGAQVWLPYYPSGVALDKAGAFVASQVADAAHSYGVEAVTVIAHSMGGLVALKAVEDVKSHGVAVKQLTTVASPLGGHGAARLGVWFSPNPQANWRDLAPGSDFLAELHSTSLSTTFVMFAVTRTPHQETDGIISLQSQMQADMVKKAKAVYQVTESHVGVLFNSDTVREILDASV